MTPPSACGGNIPLAIDQTTELRFTYDHDTHRVAVGPAQPAGGLTGADRALAGDSLREDLTRENFYFVMADRFENGDPANDKASIEGTRLEHGFDPTNQGFYHGGDLKGIIERLDYIEGLGTTAIWMTPSFKNKPVQGEPGTRVGRLPRLLDHRLHPDRPPPRHQRRAQDPHRPRPQARHQGLLRHHHQPHRRRPRLPRLGVRRHRPGAVQDQGGGRPTRTPPGNAFDDRDFTIIGDPFPEVDPEVSFPYEPTFRIPADETSRCPAWLNDPTMYHNRGTSTFSGENSEYGDFPSGNRSALDDLWTERPQVVQGMIDIYKTWVEDAGVDGFRIDTVKHVNMDFWKQFGPALQGHAASVGNDDFFMFGEVYDADPRFMSQYTTEGRLQATVDFGFQGSGVNFAKGKPTTELRGLLRPRRLLHRRRLQRLLAADLPRQPRHGARRQLPAPGHDVGDAELLERDELAHSLMYLTRGQPVVYYGDEQGFSAPPDVPGGIGDQRAREDMFPSQVALHNDTYDLIGTKATTADANFDTEPPALPAHRRPRRAARGAPRARRRRAGPPVLHERRGHLRLQPDGRRRAGRVRRGRQQRGHRADGDLRHLPAAPEHAQGGLAGVGPEEPQDRHRGAGHRHRPGRCRRSSTGRTPSCGPTTTRPMPVVHRPR